MRLLVTGASGLLGAAVVRSPHAHARIIRIDASKALALEGVKAVITRADFPTGLTGEDWNLQENTLAGDVALYDGHAVAAGLAIISRAAEALGWTEEPCAARIRAVLRRNGLPTGTEYSPAALARAALSDKKRRGGEIALVIPRKIGKCEIKSVPVEELESIFAAGWEDC